MLRWASSSIKAQLEDEAQLWSGLESIRIAWETNNIFILGVPDSSRLEGDFRNLNDVKWRKSKYQSCRSFRALIRKVQVCLIWTSDDQVTDDLLRAAEYGRGLFREGEDGKLIFEARKVINVQGSFGSFYQLGKECFRRYRNLEPTI